MTSNVKKGTERERKVREWLIDQGYKEIARTVRTRFHVYEIAGLFDLLMIKDRRKLFVQVKTNKPPRDTFNQIATYADNELGDEDDAVIIVWKMRKRQPDIYSYSNGTWFGVDNFAKRT